MPVIADKINNSETLLTIQGELDTKNCLDFKEQILKLITDGIKTVTVDLAEIDFIDSPGIGILLSASFAMDNSGGKLFLENPQMHVIDLLEATQAIKHLNVKNEVV